jgi:hypothetical protein
VEGALDGAGAFEEFLDGEELDAGVFASVGGGVEACFGGFAAHGGGGFLEGDVNADFGLLALEDADEVADLGDADVVAALDGEDDLAGVAGVVVVEVEAAIDAAVGSLLDAFGGTGSAEAERPVLELIFVLFGELACAFNSVWFFDVLYLNVKRRRNWTNGGYRFCLVYQFADGFDEP